MSNSISEYYKLPFDTSCPHCGNSQASLVEDNQSDWQRGRENRGLTLLCVAPVAEGQEDAFGRGADDQEVLATPDGHYCGEQWDPWDSDEAVDYEQAERDREDEED